MYCSLSQPFSISSAPHDEEIEFHVRALGDWTCALQKLVDEKGVVVANDKSSSQVDPAYKVLKKLDVVVEGPFGAPSVDLLTETYSVYLFITGGIGEQVLPRALYRVLT
jgi:NADPH oxidase